MGAPPTSALPTTPTRFPYFALVTVAVAIFLSVTIEMLPTGLLPQMSAELRVTEAAIGLTVSFFAFTVVLTSSWLAVLLKRVPRHRLVIIVLVILALSTLMTALAPNYTVLVASRIIGGVAHGVFWSVVGAYAAYIVPKEQLGRAVSITLGGGSLAFVIGVPLGTALGHAVGWRVSFAILALLTLIGAGFIYRFLPRVDHLGTETIVGTPTGSITVLTDELRESLAPRKDQSVVAVVFICIITAVTMIGQYSFYTFVAPFITQSMGLPEADVSAALAAYGVAGVISLVIVALFLAKWPQVSTIAALFLLLAIAVILAILPGTLALSLPAFILWGLGIGVLPPLLQTRMLHAASARIRDTANAFYTTAFNLGIGGGALVGSIMLAGFGIGALPLVNAAMLTLAIIIAVVSDQILRQQPRRRVLDH